MKTAFVSQAEAPTLKDAYEAFPWACVALAVKDGWMVFESAAAAENWQRLAEGVVDFIGKSRDDPGGDEPEPRAFWEKEK